MTQNSKWFENDFCLQLTSSQQDLVSTWLPKYIANRRNHFGQPELDDGKLKIGAPDLLDFLSYIPLSAGSEFDLLGIKKAFHLQLEELLGRDLSQDQQQHYQQILNLLKDLKLGSGSSVFSADRFQDQISQLN